MAWRHDRMFRSLVAVSAVAILFAGCSRSTASAPAPAPDPEAASAAAAIASSEAWVAQSKALRSALTPVESPGEQIVKLGYADALAMAQPLMVDVQNDDSDGAALFGLWAAKRMAWLDVAVPKDETTWALTMKDSDETRGKRLCASGSIVQIEVEKTAAGKLGTGLLRSYGGNLYRFFAAGSTGDLVESSDCRLCGVIAGKYDYSNSAGGTGHAVALVGMFDLPQNRTKKASVSSN